MIKKFNYPLLENAFSNEDIDEALKVLKSRYITMSSKTREFENYFKNFIGTKYALMVNSGSSALLLAFALLTNIKKKNRLKKNDEVLIPAICWPTSFWPAFQLGLKPKFIDVTLGSFSPSLDIIKKSISKKTRAVVLINILGNCSEIDKIKSFLNKKNIFLIEDNCESLGSVYKGKKLGSFGDVSAFSFYYSHQITSGEGGAIVCNNKNDYKILASLRAHGWDREYNKKNKKKFVFVNQGYNFRPLDLTASIALNQIKRISSFINIRTYNRNRIIHFLKKSKNWNNQFYFFMANKNLKPSWFGLPLLINKSYIKKKNRFLKYLNKNNIETRPILTGNFARQECIKIHKINNKKRKFPVSDEIDDRGFFIGLPTVKLNDNKIKILTEHLLKINKL